MIILPFQISGFTFTHVEGDAMDAATRDRWEVFHLADDYADEDSTDANYGFEVTDPVGDYYGSFGLYRVRPIDSDPLVVSALPAPLFPELRFLSSETMEFAIPEEARDSDGNVVNADFIAEVQAAEKRFWRFTFGTKEWMTLNAMPIEGGGEFRVDHFRYPSTDDGDPQAHAWIKRDVFDSYCKHTCEFDHGGAAMRTTGYKTSPPDATRMIGSFDG